MSTVHNWSDSESTNKGFAPSMSPGTSSLDELIATAQTYVASGEIPACQLAVAHNNEVVAFETFGAATNETRFCVFSATKPLVASAMWLLIGEGRVDVAKQVGEYVPEFSVGAKAHITVEQVMLHTSGFPNAPMPESQGVSQSLRRARFAQWGIEWEPGSRFEYHAGSAHWVLADIIQQVSGLDVRDFVEQRVTSPLGLPRVLGIPISQQHNIAELTAMDDAARTDDTLRFNRPEVRAAGVPGGGAFGTAADMARFYQALLHNSHNMWRTETLNDALTNVRCTFRDPLMNTPVNRTLGLVLAGDDGLHILRYAIFGQHNSPLAFGHAGAHAQVAWADPATGISFAFLTNAVGSDQMQGGIRSNRLATIASGLTL
jgi:CubicO group peptidase (beta-lactamase class C family)